MTTSSVPLSRDPLYYRQRKAMPKIVRGEGLYLFDDEGNKYMDAAGGAKVVSIGHGVQEVADAIGNQARAVGFVYTGNFRHDAQDDLAREVMNFAPSEMDQVYFTSGGSEAAEVAMKFARHYHLAQGNPKKWKIIGRWHSYHGATFGTLSVGGQTKRRVAYEPYLLNFPHIPAPYRYRCQFCQDEEACSLQCAYALERLIRQEGADTISAFMTEAVTGSSCNGMTPSPEYFRVVREICDKYNVLLIIDEVITGFGRTGSNFGIDHFNVRSDLMFCGKGMSSGYTPLGAVLISDEVSEVLASSDQQPLFTGYTYSGHPVSCAGGAAVLKYIREKHLVDNARIQGEHLMSTVIDALESSPIVGDIRGKGLLLGIEFVASKDTREPFPSETDVKGRVVNKMRDRGILIGGGGGGNVDGVLGDDIGIAPPLTISRDQVDDIVINLVEAINDVTKEVL